MFTKHDLCTIIIYYLNSHQNEWFSYDKVYDEIKDLFFENELYIGHFIFCWYKLSLNKAFIQSRKQNKYILLSINNNDNKEIMLSNEKELEKQIKEYNINKEELILHMKTYPDCYKSTEIKDFLDI